MILSFLAIEEEGNVQPVPTQGNGGGHGDGNALVGGAIEDGLPLPQLFPVGAGVEFAQSRNFLTGFDLSGVDEIGDFPAGFGGEIAEFQHTGHLQKLNEFSFVAFQNASSLFQSQNSATQRS